MNALWTYFWPAFAAGLTFGVIAATGAFRARIVRVRERPHEPDLVRPQRRRRNAFLIGGVLASMSTAALWHGPLGAAERFSSEVERSVRQTLDYWEMTRVQGRLHHGPLTRRIALSGPADDFQRSELVRVISEVPGVSSARWSAGGGGPPLILEGIAVSLLGFLFGLLLAYLLELRRRYNAQWSW
ncbi:MAG TPA: hypothetical protein VF776_08065 [Sphingomicrobium sp.]